jgi:hypothetical protein
MPICASLRWRRFPYDDDTFALATGFNSFFCANEIAVA